MLDNEWIRAYRNQRTQKYAPILWRNGWFLSTQGNLSASRLSFLILFSLSFIQMHNICTASSFTFLFSLNNIRVCLLWMHISKSTHHFEFRIMFSSLFVELFTMLFAFADALYHSLSHSFCAYAFRSAFHHTNNLIV